MRQGQLGDNGCDTNLQYTQADLMPYQKQANATAERSSTFLPPQGTQTLFMLCFAPHKANFLPMPIALCCPFPWISKLSIVHEPSQHEGQPTGDTPGQYRK